MLSGQECIRTKVELAVRAGVRRIRVGQEGLHKDPGEEDDRRDREVLGAVHHIPLVEAGMRRVVEEGRLRVVGSLVVEEEVPEDNRRIDQEEDHREEDSDLAGEVGNILLEEGRLEERRVEDVRIPVEDREVVLEADNQLEALQSSNVSIKSAIRDLGRNTYEVGVYYTTYLNVLYVWAKYNERR